MRLIFLNGQRYMYWDFRIRLNRKSAVRIPRLAENRYLYCKIIIRTAKVSRLWVRLARFLPSCLPNQYVGTRATKSMNRFLTFLCLFKPMRISWESTSAGSELALFSWTNEGRRFKRRVISSRDTRCKRKSKDKINLEAWYSWGQIRENNNKKIFFLQKSSPAN